MKKKRCTAIVLAAGQGKRMGGSVQKQFLELQGKPVLYYSLAAFQASPLIDDVILVTGEEQISYCQREIVEKYGFSKVDHITAGGAERYLSVWKGLKAMEAGGLTVPNEDGYVFIHDGARPFVTQEILERAYIAVQEYKACVVGMPVKDTIKLADEEDFAVSTPKRSLVWTIQTPQVFSVPLIREAYGKLIAAGKSDVTDDACVVEAMTEHKVKLVEGSYKNMKLTTPEDLYIAMAVLET
ncbi:MAG: 2-C-methyl-D-erythritol 4-phosphate cytidylyltransferase [Lachnospiraceae bacterium]|jgi:2-C-methyl-D-erythritol 4-phosphate cytidylyltransferase|nr:2-C-methyl-D-erythritol 4-phosphate cytidylyltransferase [Lachnospiraceae bacterium]MCI8997001.1 2-C-methyl-D-erythritol 4-phosphate cytidylyltransferase [Lachnospiraceae bacterium]